MSYYLNNNLYVYSLIIFLSFILLIGIMRKRRRSEVNIRKLIKELEDKLIKI